MINWIISSSILILIIIGLRYFFRGKISLCLQYALWLLVAVRLLIPVSFGSSTISIENVINQIILQTQIENETIQEYSAENITDFNNYDNYKNAVKIYDSVKPITQNTLLNSSENSSFKENLSVEENRVDFKVLFPKIIFCIWIAGILILGAVFIISNTYFKRKLKQSRRPIEISYSKLPVYISDGVETPCLCGIFRPCIYVTDAIVEDSLILRHSIYHEITHYKHGDLFWGVLRCLCLTLHWYNPLVWWAAKLSKQDAELACDETTIKLLGENERLAYGKTLIQLTCEKRQDLFVTATTMTSEKKSITERIKLITKKPKFSFYAFVLIILVSFIAVGCTFTSAKIAEEKPNAISETVEKTESNDIEIAESVETENNTSEIQYYDEAQKNKLCLAVMPDGISMAGGDYRYIIPENQVPWLDAYKQAKSLATDDGAWRDGEQSMGIWIVFNDEWTCVTDQGFIFDFSKRVEKTEAQNFYNLCMAQAMKYNTGTPFRPEEITEICSASLIYDDKTYTITNTEILEILEGNFSASEEIRGGAACPFTAPLILRKENGMTITIFLATDTCNAWLSDGVYYDYQGYEGIQEIYELFLAESTSMENCILKVNDTLYYGTDETGPMGDSGNVAGHIESSVNSNEVPTENGQSNFGAVDNPYTYDEGDGSIMVLMEDEEWHWFYCTQDETQSFSFLSDPMPGLPCEDPQDSGWDLKNTKDIREEFAYMSYIPDEGTENYTYLIGKTEHYTLYGKGDYQTMLLECNGKYAQIDHPYASNYMTPLELLETDFDNDGQPEVSIEFNIKHGTGLYIDTFLLADFGSDNQLYVHQFLDEDFTAQLAEHLSFEKTNKGIQPLVDGQPAGFFNENLEDMDPFYGVSVGAQMRFYYEKIKNEVQLSGEIMYLIDGYPGNLWSNSFDITATVQWNGKNFYLSDFTSRNRYLDEQVMYALQDLYGVLELYYVNVRYDSSKMNQDSMIITAEILPQETDSSYDYAEIHLKRATVPYTPCGWNIEDIFLEK